MKPVETQRPVENFRERQDFILDAELKRRATSRARTLRLERLSAGDQAARSAPLLAGVVCAACDQDHAGGCAAGGQQALQVAPWGDLVEFAAETLAGTLDADLVRPLISLRNFTVYGFKHPEMVPTRVGVLDDPLIFQPTANLWTRSAQSWHHIDRSLICFETQPES